MSSATRSVAQRRSSLLHVLLAGILIAAAGVVDATIWNHVGRWIGVAFAVAGVLVAAFASLQRRRLGVMADEANVPLMAGYRWNRSAPMR